MNIETLRCSDKSHPVTKGPKHQDLSKTLHHHTQEWNLVMLDRNGATTAGKRGIHNT
jgi:hypothetical protein